MNWLKLPTLQGSLRLGAKETSQLVDPYLLLFVFLLFIEDKVTFLCQQYKNVFSIFGVVFDKF